MKEIKEALECCAESRCKDCPYGKGESVCLDYMAQNALTLINELESENETLHNAKVVYETVDYCAEDLRKAQDRIAELENEIKENAFYSKGYAQGIKNTYEIVVPDKLKQFAERLKEKMGVREYMGVKYKQGIFSENDIDETLKEFINKGDDN